MGKNGRTAGVGDETVQLLRGVGRRRDCGWDSSDSLVREGTAPGTRAALDVPHGWESTTTSSGWAPWPPRDDQVTSVEFTSSSVSSPFTGNLPIGTLNGTEAILWTTRPRSLWTTEGSSVDRQEGSDKVRGEESAEAGDSTESSSDSTSARVGPVTSAAASASC